MGRGGVLIYAIICILNLSLNGTGALIKDQLQVYPLSRSRELIPCDFMQLSPNLGPVFYGLRKTTYPILLMFCLSLWQKSSL